MDPNKKKSRIIPFGGTYKRKDGSLRNLDGTLVTEVKKSDMVPWTGVYIDSNGVEQDIDSLFEKGGGGEGDVKDVFVNGITVLDPDDKIARVTADNVLNPLPDDYILGPDDVLVIKTPDGKVMQIDAGRAREYFSDASSDIHYNGVRLVVSTFDLVDGVSPLEPNTIYLVIKPVGPLTPHIPTVAEPFTPLDRYEWVESLLVPNKGLLTDVYYDGEWDKYFLIDDMGHVYSASNEKDWIENLSVPGVIFNKIVPITSKNKMLVIGTDGTNIVVYETVDGLTFVVSNNSLPGIAVDGVWNSMLNRAVIVCRGGETYIYDGNNSWSTGGKIENLENISCISFNATINKMIVGGEDHKIVKDNTIPAQYPVAVSGDAMSWSRPNLGGTGTPSGNTGMPGNQYYDFDFNCAATGENKTILLGIGNPRQTPNGTNFLAVGISNQSFMGVKHFPDLGIWMAVANSGSSNRIMASIGGDDWMGQSTPNHNLKALTYNSWRNVIVVAGNKQDGTSVLLLCSPS